jgi:phosphate transport system ATP-binding protein
VAPAELALLIEELMLTCENLRIEFRGNPVIKGVSLEFPEKQITAIIGPSGCGKSTLLRALNRMHDLTPGAKVSGKVLLRGRDLYARKEDPVTIRRSIGMVFQKPNPFPTMSIFANAVSGLRLAGVRKKQVLIESAERALTQAALWDEVKDRLNASAMSLSGGQQQRLCIARALAVRPQVLLMDEPCSALDPIATGKIEELIFDLKKDLTVVMVTHNMQQAARASDRTAFLWMGELVETDITERMFTNPGNKLTEDYITGRFG